MTERTPAALVMSLALHALVVAMLLLFAYAMNERVKEAPKIFELVVGPGNNYNATVAAALGVPGGVQMTVPVPPPPKPEPTPVMPEAPPLQPAPLPEKAAPPVQAAPAAKKTPDFAKQIRAQVIKADSKAKQQLAREHADEAKRLAKEEADRAKQAKSAKFTPIDSEGIRQGVVGASTDNKIGGAGGKALTAEEGSAIERFEAMLKLRLQQALERPPGLSDNLVATVEFRISAGGALSGVRIKQTSGSAEFDRAVVEAFARVGSVGPRPKGEPELLALDFKMKEVEGG
jgi:TonB family protein